MDQRDGEVCSRNIGVCDDDLARVVYTKSSMDVTPGSLLTCLEQSI